MLAASLCPAAELKMPSVESQWKGARVVFLGDSITDKKHIGTEKNYWQYLEESLGIKPLVYAVNGQRFSHIPSQALKMEAEIGKNFDAIIVFCGTNDFMAGVPLGDWYKVEDAPAPVAGGVEMRKRRALNLDVSTFRGRINAVMKFLKSRFPEKQIILLTPIHRGYAKFSEKNVQADESFPNKIGVYFDEYAAAVAQAANVWAVPVIDLNSICGLYPNWPKHDRYFSKPDTDLLHPNAFGHYRIALALTYALRAYPAGFGESE